MHYAILAQGSGFNEKSPLLYFRNEKDFQQFIDIMLSDEKKNRAMSFNSCGYIDGSEGEYYSSSNKLNLVVENGNRYIFSWSGYYCSEHSFEHYSVEFWSSIETAKFKEELKRFISIPPCAPDEANALVFKKKLKNTDKTTELVLLASPRLQTIRKSVHQRIDMYGNGYADRKNLRLVSTSSHGWVLMPDSSYIYTFRDRSAESPFYRKSDKSTSRKEEEYAEDSSSLNSRFVDYMEKAGYGSMPPMLKDRRFLREPSSGDRKWKTPQKSKKRISSFTSTAINILLTLIICRLIISLIRSLIG